jgi:hypothetical protein
MGKALVWGVALACCGCADDDEPERRRYANEGTVCLSSNASEVLHAQVVAPVCLSGSCDRLWTRLASSVSPGIGSIEKTGVNDCTADCGYATAQCSSELAVAGDFTVSHGSDTESVMLPQSALVLFEDTSAAFACDFSFSQ